MALDLRSIYVANGVGIVILLMLFFTSRTRISRRRPEDRVYSFMVVGVLIACFMEAASYTVDGAMFLGSRMLNYAINTCLYTVNLLLSFSVLVYADLGIYGDPARIPRVYRPQIAVAAVMFVVNVVNLFTPISFVITADNVYQRTPVSYVYYVIIMYYCLTALFLTRRYERENGAKAFFDIKFFLVPIMVGAGLQFMFYGLSLAWVSAAIGLTGLFMMQQNEMAYTDSLVDIYNRQYLGHIVSAWTRRGISFCGVMLDVDEFKSINDTWGHSEGDRALKTLAGILQDARLNGEWVFRFAGDEFIVLKMADSERGLDDYLAEVERRLAAHNRKHTRYALQISYGASYFEAGTDSGSGNIDAFIGEMDERMYQMKAQHHAQVR